jgi:hypothetical protein
MTLIALSACSNLCYRVADGGTVTTTTTTTTATKISKEQGDVQEHLEKYRDTDKARKPE